MLVYCMAFWLCSANFAMGAPKVEIKPQTRPSLSYKTTPDTLVYNSDKSWGYMTYHMESFHNSQLAGWVTIGGDLTVSWKDEKITGYSETNRAIVGGYDINLITQAANSANVPVSIVEAGVIGHEKRHVEDHSNKKNSLLSFEGFSGSSADASGIKERRAELSDRMEALAMTAEINAMKTKAKDSQKKVKSIEKSLKRITTIQEQLHNLNDPSNPKNAKKSPEKIEKEINKLTKELQKLTDNRAKERWDEILPELREAAKYASWTDEQWEALMLEMIGDSRITGSGTKYVDAYNKYAKRYNAKKNRYDKISIKDQEKQLHAAVEKYNPVLEAYFQEHYKQEIAANPSSSGFAEFELPQNVRPVCRPCMMGDTMGNCNYSWCANGKGNRCKDFKAQRGDYIPLDYDDPLSHPHNIIRNFDKNKKK